MRKNDDEKAGQARITKRLLIMIVLLLGLIASAIARRVIEGRRTEPPRPKRSSREDLWRVRPDGRNP
jgi:hypothetical protein